MRIGPLKLKLQLICGDGMNRCFRERLVDTLPGGGRERGARLSDCGREVLAAYRELEAATPARRGGKVNICGWQRP